MASHSTMLLAAAAVLGTLATAPSAHAGRSMSISDRDGERIGSCAQIRMHFDHGATVRGEQVLELSTKEAPQLRVDAPENGGVRVQGWDGPGYRVLACKAVDDSEPDALSRITVALEGGRLKVHGPESDDWFVHLVIDAPRGASIEVTAENGPISVLEVSGSVRLSTVNGPVSALRSEGTLRIDATNGPVSLVDVSGDVTVDAQNGPLSVKLADGSWRGTGMNASTENGPLSLRVPDDYRSGVEVTMGKGAPFRCSIDDCDAARRNTEGSTRTVELGSSSSTAVRLSTHNGPVSIRSRS